MSFKTIFAKYYETYRNLFLGNRLFAGIAVCVVGFLLSFFWPWLEGVPEICFWVLAGLSVLDMVLLYLRPRPIFLVRELPQRLSNGDDNELSIHVENFYPFSVHLGIIDEIPFQFQKRDLCFEARCKAGEKKHILYQLRPVSRGEYEFGQIRVYVQSPLRLITRRINFDQGATVAVYPSFLQLRKYELMAISNRLTEMGIKKIRKVGHSLEFDQVKEYVQGDDQRTVNWKATARKGGQLMVNSFTDLRAQHVYCVIDKSRAMKMPFEGLSLMDYAINASLVLSSVALIKQDKAGLLTFGEQMGSMVAADRKNTQMERIMQVLYREKTRYLEANLELLYASVRSGIKQRSLMVFFTNFESMSALQRQLPYLRALSKFHMLLVVLFENTELKALSQKTAANVEEIYIHTIAAKFVHEKRLMVKELSRHGILSMLSTPQQLTINVVNRYLEIKARQRA